jgi:hypothetical protein
MTKALLAVKVHCFVPWASPCVSSHRKSQHNKQPVSWQAKIERIIVLLSASPEGEARLPMPKGMAYKE